MTQSLLKICITGANGKMGLALQTLISSQQTKLQLVAAIGRVNTASSDANNSLVQITNLSQLAEKPDVIIDFSKPDFSLEIAAQAQQQKIPFVSGTTGFSDTQINSLKKISHHIPLLWAANMSLGITLAHALIKLSSAVLGEDVQVEITEAHHIHKLDAPSGTALALAREIAASRSKSVEDLISYEGENKSFNHAPDKIGFNVIRQGEIIGEHRVEFNLDGEQLAIEHKANDRNLFAKGALRAGLWIVGRQPGWYNMADVLEIRKQISGII